MILYHDESVLFKLNADVPCIEFMPSGLPKSTDHLKQAYYMLLRFCEEQIVTFKNLSLLVDIRNSDGITSQDNEWIASEIIPKFIALGIKKMALVDGVTELAHITSEEFLELSARSPIQHLLFKDHESAVKWLLMK